MIMGITKLLHLKKRNLPNLRRKRNNSQSLIKHIGIVACSAEGAALCYQTICKEATEVMGRHNHPEISMHTHSLSKYMDCIYENDWDGVAQLMISSAKKLEIAGASFLICPDNTIHQAFPAIRKESSLPWLHIAEEVTKLIIRQKYSKVLVLGTKYLMTGPVYAEVFEREEIEYLIPDEKTRNQIDRIIMDELVNGIIKDESKKFFLQVINDFKLTGCDAVVLGCTEIPLIVLPADSPLPVLDSTRILARAAIKEALPYLVG
jgi:aspartate racemase